MTGLLAIETATSHGSVALWERGAVVMEETFTAPRGHNTAIFGPLKRILDEGQSRIERVVVGTGPGSYGGVRVGIAVANTLGVALGISAVGIPSLLAVAGSERPDYTVVGDARRGAFFVARIRAHRLDGEIELLEDEAFREVLGEVTSGGESVITFDESVPAVFEEMEVATEIPAAGVLAERFSEMTSEEVRALRARPLEPIYLRAPYITTPKGQ